MICKRNGLPPPTICSPVTSSHEAINLCHCGERRPTCPSSLHVASIDQSAAMMESYKTSTLGGNNQTACLDFPLIYSDVSVVNDDCIGCSMLRYWGKQISGTVPSKPWRGCEKLRNVCIRISRSRVWVRTCSIFHIVSLLSMMEILCFACSLREMNT